MFVSALVALSVASGAPTCKTADPRIETLVASYAKKTQSDEYCQTRLYHTIDDLDGDGRDDFVLVFSLELKAGNYSAQYLAVFPSSKAWKPLVVKVGERGERFVDQIDVEENRTLVLSTSEYEEDDPMCCPSGEGEVRYRLDKGQLVLVPNPPEDEDTAPANGKKGKTRQASDRAGDFQRDRVLARERRRQRHVEARVILRPGEGAGRAEQAHAGDRAAADMRRALGQ
jgi:hypothetical protein